MSERLTDFDVANQLVLYGEVGSMDFDPDVLALAREVQEYRALRPTCPTCDGTCEVVVTQDGMGETVHAHVICPDCTDGKMPLDKWVALLVADSERLAAAYSRECACIPEGLSYRCEAHAAHDAVLKMAGVT